jgi:predicted N-formylglutamate amidohydrolase
MKPADRGSLLLAHAVAQASGAWLIFVSSDSPRDPNYYEDNPYKDSLLEIADKVQLKFVLDIHSAHPSYPFDIDISSILGASWRGNPHLCARLFALLADHGVHSISDNFFGAYKAHTVTKHAMNEGFQACQVEVSAAIMNGEGGLMAWHQLAKIANALALFLHEAASS